MSSTLACASALNSSFTPPKISGCPDKGVVAMPSALTPILASAWSKLGKMPKTPDDPVIGPGSARMRAAGVDTTSPPADATFHIQPHTGHLKQQKATCETDVYRMDCGVEAR